MGTQNKIFVLCMGNILGRSKKVYPLLFDKIALEEEECCSICLEKFDDNHVTLPCKHHYHENCIMRWFDDKSDCPLCREKVGLKLINITSD